MKREAQCAATAAKEEVKHVQWRNWIKKVRVKL